MVNKVLPEERIPLLKRFVKELDGHILFWDLESSPNEGYWWDSNKPQYMSYKQIKKGKETKIISIQFMWEGDKDPQYLVWDGDEEGNFNDADMIEYFITNVLRKYPTDKLIIIGQNHKAFDHMLLNERAKVLRLTPPINTMIKVDTYKHSKSSFKTASHSLDARSIQYNLGGKDYTDLSTWTDILEFKTDPEDYLVPYGLKDVTDLRTIFWNDLPYYSSLPAPLERLLLKAKARCENCEKNKQRKYDLEECKVDQKNGWKCLNCNNKFIM